VDFGPDANAFLRSCGAKTTPTATDVARAVLERGADLGVDLLHEALKYLAPLASTIPRAQKSQLGKARLLVAVQGRDGALQRADAGSVFLDDDAGLRQLVKALVPPSNDLYTLYTDAGCQVRCFTGSVGGRGGEERVLC
jgi:hypothetical protein